MISGTQLLRIGVISLFLSAQASHSLIAETRATLKVKNNGSLFSMFSGNKTMSAVMCADRGDTLVTEEKLSRSAYCSFLLVSGEGLQFDKDWLDENLPGVYLTQNGMRYDIVFRDSLQSDNATSWVMIGFDKGIQLHQAFTISSMIGTARDEQPILVPEELWPGRAAVLRMLGEGNELLRNGKYAAAVTAFNRLIGDSSLAIFTEYAAARVNRLKAFTAALLEHQQVITRTLAADTTLVMEKIRIVESHIGALRFVADSAALLPRGRAEAGEIALQTEAAAKVRLTEQRLDSLRRAYDDASVGWIITGRTQGLPDPRYRHMIDALTRAFLSCDFSDPAAPELRIELPERTASLLRRYGIRESYDIFTRIANSARLQRQPMFSDTMLRTVAADSLSQPYEQALRAVNEVFRGNLAGALGNAGEALKQSTDESLCLQLDEFRFRIPAIRGAAQSNILAKMKEGAASEAAGDTAKALDCYKYVIDLIPSYVPADLALARIQERRGESLRAANFLRRAVRQDPFSFSAILHIVTSLEHAESYENLYKTLADAMEKQNDTYYIHRYAGRVLRKMGKNREALAHAEKALQCNPRGAGAMVVAAYASAALNEFAKASEFVTRAGEIDPEDDEVIECQKELAQRSRKKEPEVQKKETGASKKEE